MTNQLIHEVDDLIGVTTVKIRSSEYNSHAVHTVTSIISFMCTWRPPHSQKRSLVAVHNSEDVITSHFHRSSACGRAAPILYIRYDKQDSQVTPPRLLNYCFPLAFRIRIKFNEITREHQPLVHEYLRYLRSSAARLPDLSEFQLTQKCWDGSKRILFIVSTGQLIPTHNEKVNLHPVLEW